MASTSSIIRAMNSITLDDEEEGDLAIEEIGGEESTENFKDLNIQLCLVIKAFHNGGSDRVPGYAANIDIDLET